MGSEVLGRQAAPVQEDVIELLVEFATDDQDRLILEGFRFSAPDDYAWVYLSFMFDDHTVIIYGMIEFVWSKVARTYLDDLYEVGVTDAKAFLSLEALSVYVKSAKSKLNDDNNTIINERTAKKFSIRDSTEGVLFRYDTFDDDDF